MLTTKRRKITRGGVAKYFGIAKNTIRNYEKLSLVEPHKGGNDYRYFTDEDLSYIILIRMMRELGWSLSDIHHLTHECDLADLSLAILNQISLLEKQRQELDEQIARLSRFSTKVKRAMTTPFYEILDPGPTLLWRNRVYLDESKNNWFPFMPEASISGILTITEKGLSVETGLAVIANNASPLAGKLADSAKHVETGHCVHCIKPCRLVDGDYVYEDYEPLFAYARNNGFHPQNWLITYGLAHVNTKNDPTFYLELFLPLRD